MTLRQEPLDGRADVALHTGVFAHYLADLTTFRPVEKEPVSIVVIYVQESNRNLKKTTTKTVISQSDRLV